MCEVSMLPSDCEDKLNETDSYSISWTSINLNLSKSHSHVTFNSWITAKINAHSINYFYIQNNRPNYLVGYLNISQLQRQAAVDRF